MLKLTEVTLGADVTAIVSALREHGACVVHGLLSPETVQSVNKVFDQVLAGLPWCNTTQTDKAYPDEFFGTQTKRLHGVVQYAEEIEEALMHPASLHVASALLQEDNLIASTGELMAIGSGQTRQRLHRDGVSWHKSRLDREFLFSVNIAVTDFHQGNGATVVVPGSHLWPSDRVPQDAELTYAEMPAGSALLYVGQVLHGGGANATDKTRIGLYFGYLPAWMRPLENFDQTVPRACWANLQPATKTMLGELPDGFVANF